jgi:general secretion pathway protein D
MKERQQFVEQFYGQVPGYDVAVDFTRKPGPLSRMNQSVIKEQQRAENGGPGANGERIIGPSSGSPTNGQRNGKPAPAPGPTQEAPAPESPAGEPPVREVTPPPGGSDDSVPTAPAPQTPEAPAPESQPAPDDAATGGLRIQPESGDQSP